jgi:division protein CdvB (Snf7/Vps24/ESCRT-III family)
MTAAAVALSVLVPAVGAAQVPEETPDVEELITFATAFVEISEVREEVAVQLEEATTPAEAAEIQAEADERMVEILDERELDPDRYNEIVQLVNTDQELRVEFQRILLEVTQAGDPGA